MYLCDCLFSARSQLSAAQVHYWMPQDTLNLYVCGMFWPLRTRHIPSVRLFLGRFQRVVLVEACPPLAQAARENLQRNGAATWLSCRTSKWCSLTSPWQFGVAQKNNTCQSQLLCTIVFHTVFFVWIIHLHWDDFVWPATLGWDWLCWMLCTMSEIWHIRAYVDCACVSRRVCCFRSFGLYAMTCKAYQLDKPQTTLNKKTW